MAISHYLKDIGRGKDGARALDRAQATDLLGQVLDGTASDLEVGAFCIAMRIKGETPEEMAGFLDAIHQRLPRLAAPERPLVVLPSYNGARKLPLLTPLLALLLARQGLSVLVHGSATEERRASSADVLAQLGVAPQPVLQTPAPGGVAYAPTALLLPGLERLLQVRRVLGLRNSAHSIVVGSYTHPEYAQSMAATCALTGTCALLLRGTEGEPVADPRRTPQMDAYLHGQHQRVQEVQAGPLAALPQLPTAIDAASTAAWIRSVLDGAQPVPAPIARQVEHILRMAGQMSTEPAHDAHHLPTPPAPH
ncbi:MAG: DNA-binding protein YbiB [Giesbergeria sp.]